MATQVPNRMLAFDGGNFAFRNKIINGDFRIDQRLALSVDNTNAAIKWVGDRWFAGFTAVNTFNTQCLSSDAPVGFRNSARVTLATQRTPAANDLYCFVQRIETQNLYNLNYGTASAKPITISFWVKSSIIGTYSARVAYSNDTTPALSYVYTYTINQANTWEFKIVTIPGNTTQGFYIAPNSIGFDVLWNLGTGSTRSTASTNQWLAGDFHTANSTISFVNQTAGATWQIAGVQLEEGSYATPFEQRPIGTELALCQRYFQYYPGNWTNAGYTTSGTAQVITTPLPVPMRTSPVINFTPLNVVNATLAYFDDGGSNDRVFFGVFSTSSTGGVFQYTAQNASFYAEL
jgi:hypothetical protein